MRKENEIEDNQMRRIFSGTGINASDNLKFRIMQQIETEKALSRKKAKNGFSVIKNMLSVYGVMYGIIIVLAVSVYSMYGKTILESTAMLLLVLLIVSVCGMFWMISIFDEKRRNKKKH